MILPPVMIAGNVPVCEQPALVNVHAPSKLSPSCRGDDRGAGSVGRSVSFLGPDSDLSVSPMLPPVEPDCANVQTALVATTSEAPRKAAIRQKRMSRRMALSFRWLALRTSNQNRACCRDRQACTRALAASGTRSGPACPLTETPPLTNKRMIGRAEPGQSSRFHRREQPGEDKRFPFRHCVG
jgi:hypothetical protein